MTFDNVSVLAAVNDQLSVDPGASGTVNVLANDTGPSGSTLTVSAFTQGSKGTVSNAGGGSLTYVPGASAIGVDSFSYTVSDGLGDTATATVSVSINGLRAWYRFEEGTGSTTADLTGDPYTCALQGTTWSTGVEGTGGVTFAGTSSSYGTVPALNLNTNTMTLTGWVKRSGSQSSWTGIAFCRSGSTVSGLHFGTANELRYTWSNSASTYNWNSTLTVPDGQWTFVAMVVTATNTTLYMQPQGGAMRSAVNNLANSAAAFDGPMMLGQDPNGGVRYFNGQMDEMRIYNIALDAASVASLAAAAPVTATPASATSLPASSLTTSLSVLGSSNFYPEASLTYNWSVLSVPSGAITPVFSSNGSNASKGTVVTIYQSGAYSFQVTMADPFGGTSTSIVNKTLTLKPMDAWRVAKFGTSATIPAVAANEVDGDLDGLSNLMEYALNTSPTAFQRDTLPVFAYEGSNVSITYRQNDVATDLLYTVEQSQDLVHWIPASPVNTTLSDDGSTRLIKATVPLNGASRLMLRLNVTPQ